MNFTRQTDGGLFLPDKRLCMPKHHGMRYPAVIGGPGSGNGVVEAPFDGILRADYESGADLTVYGGSPTGTLFGGATVHDGLLDLFNGGFQRVEYDSNNNWQPINLGTVNILYQPYYSGIPVTAQYPFFKGRNADTRNQIAIQHAGVTGDLIFWFRTAAGTYVYDNNTGNFGAWSPTAGQTYEIEINFDTRAGTPETRLFIDGTQFGATKTGTGDLTSEPTNLIRIGAGANSGSNQSYFKVLDFKIWDTVQHTSDY